MRLDQFLSARTMYSRRELRQMIQKGKVTVDGAVVRKAEQAVQPEVLTGCLNGREICGDQYRYVLLHKPKGYVSSADEAGQKSVLELVPPELCRKDLRPVGRLDKDSTGMLLLTDDGQLAHQVIAARGHVAKYYHIVLARPWEDGYLQPLEQGITLADGAQCLPAKAAPVPDTDREAIVCMRGSIIRYAACLPLWGIMSVNWHVLQWADCCCRRNCRWERVVCCLKKMSKNC